MRGLVIGLLAIIWAAPMAAQKETTAPSSKLSSTLTMAAESPSVTAGSDLWVEVRWTNTSSKEINASRYIDKSSGRDTSYVLDFRDSAGNPVAKSPAKFPVPGLFDAQLGTLKPGESISNNINLRRLYDLNRPGKYTLQVSRKLPEELGGGMVRSNTMTVAVTQPHREWMALAEDGVREKDQLRARRCGFSQARFWRPLCF